MERFYNKVKKSENGCWDWIAGSRGKGYGAFNFEGKTVDAHRVSFILHKGDIPNGLLVCHTCDNRNCVNPSHLFLGTYQDNYDDMVDKGRRFIQPKMPIELRKKRLSKGSRFGKYAGTENHNSKVVLDISTGVFFDSCKEASDAYRIKNSTLRVKLSGHYANNTNLSYV